MTDSTTLRATADALNDEVTRPDAPTPETLDDVVTFDDLVRFSVAQLHEAADALEAAQQ